MTDITINEIETQQNILGPIVLLKQLVKDQDGGIRWEEHRLTAIEAMGEILYGSRNGMGVLRAKIEYQGVIDLWGQSV